MNRILENNDTLSQMGATVAGSAYMLNEIQILNDTTFLWIGIAGGIASFIGVLDKWQKVKPLSTIPKLVLIVDTIRGFLMGVVFVNLLFFVLSQFGREVLSKYMSVDVQEVSSVIWLLVSVVLSFFTTEIIDKIARKEMSGIDSKEKQDET